MSARASAAGDSDRFAAATAASRCLRASAPSPSCHSGGGQHRLGMRDLREVPERLEPGERPAGSLGRPLRIGIRERFCQFQLDAAHATRSSGQSSSALR